MTPDGSSSPRRPLGRRSQVSLASAMALALLFTVLPPTTPDAHADSGMESAFVAAVNRERAAIGLGALTVAADLTTVARTHSQVMAGGTDLHHNPNLGRDVSGWDKVGENVGRGPSVDAIHAALMASPGHERNILDPGWTQLGMGVVVEDGRIWVTQLFRTPVGAAPAAAPVTPPDPEPAPEPRAEPVVPSPVPAPADDAKEVAGTPAAPPAASETEPPLRAREALEVPIATDRLTIVLARLDAAERSTTLAAVLG